MEYIALGYRLMVDCSNAHNLINTIFISFSIRLFHRSIGIAVSSNCAPLFIYLFWLIVVLAIGV